MKDFKSIKKNLMKLNVAAASITPTERIILSEETRVGTENKTEQKTIVKSLIEKVKNIDQKEVEFVLKSGIDHLDPVSGFLVEVFVSGSDGKLQRLYREDLVDVNGNVKEEGFERYMTIQIDKQ